MRRRRKKGRCKIIYIDSRIGSRELIDLIDNSLLVNLEFGDVMFEGNGIEGKMQIGIERKKWSDLISSSRSGRLVGHQLIGLINNYYRVYLICEGICRENTKGEIEEWKHGKWRKTDYAESEKARRRFGYEPLWKHLTTLEEKMGVVVRSTHDMVETARAIETLYHWWNEPWESHKSHLQIHRPREILRPEKASLLRRIVSELPGVGYTRAIQVEKYFGSVESGAIERMFLAPIERWQEIEGFGKITAKVAWESLHI